MNKFLASIISAVLLFTAGVSFAAEPENILMIEVAGEANGVIEIELLPELAPAHVERIKILARDGVYNDVAFHRVIEGFMAQTGDVKFGKIEGYKQRYAGQGGSNYPDLPAEFSDVPYEQGTVGMARSQLPNSANSQFFIMFAPNSNLDGQYTVFGQVIEGQDIVDSIKLGARNNNGSVSNPDVMKRVWIKADG
jgi:cyclophilin family peptidyl-prolyl cis-trans isomerase